MLHFGEITNQVFRVLITDNSVKVTDPTVHYLINTFFLICMIIYSTYINKAGRKVPDLNPFRFAEIQNLPGYKTYFTILEEGVTPSSKPPTSGSPIFASRQRMTTKSEPDCRKIAVSQPEKLLGCGSFGTKVLAGLWEGKKKCAIKVVDDTGKNVERVIEIMRAMDFHNTIKYLGFEISCSRTLICMELALTDLWVLLQGGKNTDSFPLTPREIALQLMECVSKLHERGIAHGNLDPTNMLVVIEGTTPVIKIGGYGRSCRRDNPSDINMFKARLNLDRNKQWRAPELYELDYIKFKDLIKADIYTLGCTIAYIMSRGRYHEPIMYLKYLDELKESLHDHTDPITDDEVQGLRCMDLLVCMTAPNPWDRPSIECAAMYQALWDGARNRSFLWVTSSTLKVSETLEKPQHNLVKKKSTNRAFKKRSSSSKRRQSIGSGELARNENPAQEATHEPVVNPTEGLTKEQISSLMFRNIIRDYSFEICRGSNWMRLLPTRLFEILPQQYRNYDGECAISLIRLIRNLTSHLTENNSKFPELKKISGGTEDELQRFFERIFPLLQPIIYREGQDFKAMLDPRKEFYDPDEDMNLHQTGTLGAVCGLFEDEMWWVEEGLGVARFMRSNESDFDEWKKKNNDQEDYELIFKV